MDEYFEILKDVFPNRPEKAGHYIRPNDVLNISSQGALPDAPIGGPYDIQPQGTIPLGAPYGHVQVKGMTIDEARLAITRHLQNFLKQPSVHVSYAKLADKKIERRDGSGSRQ